MTFDELTEKVLRDYPDAEIEEDDDGQLIIYTGLKTASEEEIVNFED